jgi:hypothetical protein
VLILKAPIARHRSQQPEQQKLTILIQIYIFTWILLLLSTVVAKESGIGGLYFVSAWNMAVFLGSVFGCLEVMFGSKGAEGESRDGVQFEAHDTAGGVEAAERDHGAVVETEPTEITPLIQQHRARPPTLLRSRQDEWAAVWWILQAVAAVPIPVILVVHIAVILLASLPQTLSDGSSPVIGTF